MIGEHPQAPQENSRELPGARPAFMRVHVWFRAEWKTPLFRPAAVEYHLGRLKENGEVQQDGHVLDVEKIILQLDLGLFDAGAVLILDLRPAGDAGPHRVALRIQ